MGDILDEELEVEGDDLEEDWGGLLYPDGVDQKRDYADWNVKVKEEEGQSKGRKRTHDGEEISDDDTYTQAIPQARELFAAAARDDVDTVARLALSWHRREGGLYTETTNMLLMAAHSQASERAPPSTCSPQPPLPRPGRRSRSARPGAGRPRSDRSRARFATQRRRAGTRSTSPLGTTACSRFGTSSLCPRRPPRTTRARSR